MALKTLSVLESAVGSHWEEARPDRRRQGANTQIYWEDQPILPSIGEQPNQRVHHEDYQIALVPRQKVAHSSESIPQPSTWHRVFVLPLTWQEFLERVREEVNPYRARDNGMTSQFGEVRVNFLTMQISRSERPVALTAQQFKLLRFLTQSPARVFSRDELLNEVWGYKHYPSTRTVDNHNCKLRRKLERNRDRPIHFLTVRGIGYKFVP